MLACDRWFTDAIMVFEGEFTCEEDKRKLVDAVLGLWALAVHAERRRKLIKDRFPLKRQDEYYSFPFSFIRRNRASVHVQRYAAGASLPRSSSQTQCCGPDDQSTPGSEEKYVDTIFQLTTTLRNRVFPAHLFGKQPLMLEEESSNPCPPFLWRSLNEIFLLRRCC